MCQYLLTGEDHTVLVDTGLAGTPEEVIIPYLEGVRLSLEDIDEVIISHADVDHCGGNRALKEMHPALWFVRRARQSLRREQRGDDRGDLPLVRALRLRPGRGLSRVDQQGAGRRLPVDAGLRGKETMRLGPERRIEILHLLATRRATSASGTRRTGRRSS